MEDSSGHLAVIAKVIFSHQRNKKANWLFNRYSAQHEPGVEIRRRVLFCTQRLLNRQPVNHNFAGGIVLCFNWLQFGRVFVVMDVRSRWFCRYAPFSFQISISTRRCFLRLYLPNLFGFEYVCAIRQDFDPRHQVSSPQRRLGRRHVGHRIG